MRHRALPQCRNKETTERSAQPGFAALRFFRTADPGLRNLHQYTAILLRSISRHPAALVGVVAKLLRIGSVGFPISFHPEKFRMKLIPL
jgi:hypothetical protein